MLTPKRRTVISTSMELSPQATCADEVCEFATGQVASAVAQAREHAEATGHAVTIDHVTREMVLGA